MGKSILLVDDEDFFRSRLKKAFVGRGFEVFDAANFDEAIKSIRINRPLMGVIDLKMPGRSGLEVIKVAKEIHSEMCVVVLTGYGSISTAMEAIKLGAFSYLPKPADVDDILTAFAKNKELDISEIDSEISTPSLARAEWEHINRVLHDCGGNISAAAKKLGLHRRTLQRKLFKYAPNK